MIRRITALLIIISIQLLFSQTTIGQGFLKTSGQKIVDGNDNEVLLKGFGLGGWLVQEGYMLHTSSFGDAEHQLRAKIEELIGVQKTEEFYAEYIKNYVRRIDIDKIAEWGFNSIRLPMHYNKLTPFDQPYVYLEEGFLVIDSLLSWCEDNELYLILDLHAAPGGQSAGAIADYNPAYSSLWESDENKARTVALWRKLAERYVNEEWIGGYDLINEPAWDLGPNAVPLRDLYIDITNAIREVDTNHIVFIEGNWWATTFDGLTPPWDDNMVYSFHKYWNANDAGAIQYLLNLRSNANVPLWLGETGENSNAWFLDCVNLMENKNIGWAWWPHKKIDNISGPLSSPRQPQYQQLLDYWNGTAPQPSVDFAYAALMLQADKLKLENCKFQPGIIDALIRQPEDDSSIPLKQHNLPGRIYASDYNLGKRLSAYQDVDYENTGGSNNVWNRGWSHRNDGVDIEACTDSETNGYNVGWIETGEWLKFTVNIQYAGTYNLKIRAAANQTGGKILFTLGSENITDFIDIPSTGGWQNWQTVTVEGVTLPEGIQDLQIRFFFGGFNLNYVEFDAIAVDVQENEIIPNRLQLEQNYPNPFNPSTKIKFSVPSSEKQNKSFVQLKVYDSIGNEIELLVNEEKHPGNYEIEFTGENLSSGTYFYQLKVDNRIETRKMILLK